MRRREFIAVLGAAASSLSLTQSLSARAQSVQPVIGFLGSEVEEMRSARFRAFHEALAEAGFVEGRNVAIEYRWSAGLVQRFPELVADLVRRNVTVIAALAGIPAATAAKAATKIIPVVTQGGFDPVEIGLVASLNRPGGNITGVTNLGLALGPKRLEVMHELIPTAKIFALLINPEHPNARAQISQMQEAARTLGLEIRVVPAVAVQDFDKAFTSLTHAGARALIVGAGQPFTTRAPELGELAARHKVPAISESHEFVTAGGLMSYSGSREDAFRLAGRYVARILKGEKPADLPIAQSTKVELMINMKAAKVLGLNIPLPLLGRADEVIE